MGLEAELDLYRRQISADAYQMSIGELANLYRDGELNIHPEFQRFFRWTSIQRSRLIESILLGIPLPSLFVAAGEEGWDVVDGVQRLSTIFQFMGILEDEDGNVLAPLVCESAPFLKSLDGISYEPQPGSKRSLSSTQRIDFKRARVDVKIIKRESDTRAKYDLFQRLNSYGSIATEQELRNCLLVSLSKPHYEWLRDLSEQETFLEVLNLPDRLIGERYHMEIALRFIALRKASESTIRGMGNLGEFLTAEVLPLVERKIASLNKEEKVFKQTFAVLNETGGADILRRWNKERARPEGTFSALAFEVLALGIGYYDADARITPAMVQSKREELWTNPDFAVGFSQGIRADTRMRKSVSFGRQLFSS